MATRSGIRAQDAKLEIETFWHSGLNALPYTRPPRYYCEAHRRDAQYLFVLNSIVSYLCYDVDNWTDRAGCTLMKGYLPARQICRFQGSYEVPNG